MDYDIGKAFAAIEEELIASMMRNMERHREWETDEGFQWSMWQAEQLKALEQYKRTNKKKFERQFNEINGSIRMLIEQAREQGGMDQELEILDAIQNGWKPKRFPKNQLDISGEFFKLNTRKLEALIKATENDFRRAEVAMLRMADDQYRQVIFNAQVYANTGAGTYEQAVDMATKDFMSRGINCIQYANGARHTMRDYAAMAIRTAAKRAYLAGEGEKRQEWGIDTVIVNKRGNPCPKCLPFVGKILIDDVWSGGSSDPDQKYPLMSTAVAAGLYHPNCKDAHSTYFPGISSAPDDVFTKGEIADVEETYRKEQRQKYAERQTEKYSRLASYSLDSDNKKRYTLLAEQWKQKNGINYSGLIPTYAMKPLEYAGGSGKMGLAKASAIFVNNKERLYHNAQNIKKMDNYDDIVCHGTPDLFEIDVIGEGNEVDIIRLTPKEFAERIRKSNGYVGGDIRLISCQTGAKENGAAQKLADELGVNVYAPTEIVNVDDDGRLFLTDNDILADLWYNAGEEEKDKFIQTGEWKLFKPRKTK